MQTVTELNDIVNGFFYTGNSFTVQISMHLLR